MLSVAETTFDLISIDSTFLKLTPESMINYELKFASMCNYNIYHVRRPVIYQIYQNHKLYEHYSFLTNKLQIDPLTVANSMIR